MSWRIYSPSFALAAGAFRRMAPNGVAPVTISASPMKRVVTRCLFRCSNARGAFFTVVPDAERNFRESAGSNARSPVWIAAENSTGGSSIPKRVCVWWKSARTHAFELQISHPARHVYLGCARARLRPRNGPGEPSANSLDREPHRVDAPVSAADGRSVHRRLCNLQRLGRRRSQHLEPVSRPHEICGRPQFDPSADGRGRKYLSHDGEHLLRHALRERRPRPHSGVVT